MSKPPVDIEVELLHETEKAWLVTIDGENEVWVAKSVGELREENGKTMLELPEPYAIKKELI